MSPNSPAQGLGCNCADFASWSLLRTLSASASAADRDRLAVPEMGLLRGPLAAGPAAAQWRDRHLDLIAGLERRPRPSLPLQHWGRLSFQRPGLHAAVLSLHLQDDEGVRVDEAELLHRPVELDRAAVLEHRERMVRQGGIARHQQRAADQTDANTPGPQS